MNATISLNSVTLADVPFNGLGHVAVSGGRKPIAHQRARFTVDADQRCCTAGLIEQVPDLAKIADALLAQQRVHVRGGQAGPGKFTILDLASGDKDPGRMVNDAGDPAMPPGERHKAVHDQEGDKRDRADGERPDGAVTVRPMIAPMATATAKSNAPSWASVRRSPSRRPMTATANIRTALTATQPRPPVSPTSSSNRLTPCAYRQPECLPGQVCVQAPRSP